MGNAGVYILTNISGKVYVGSSSDCFRRKTTHLYQLRNGVHHNPHLQNAWNKYGEQAFCFAVLEYINGDEKKLRESEQEWIIRLLATDRNYGYNITANTIAPAKGRKWTAEHKAKISAANRGKPVSPETREKIAASLQGRKASPTTLAKMREKKLSPEHKEKISVALRGRPHSLDHNAKVAAASKKRASTVSGVTFSPSRQRWEASKTIDGTRIIHRMFMTKEEAVKAANDAVKKYKTEANTQ